MTIPEAVKTWLNYNDKDIYSEEQYKEATRSEAIRMRDELNKEILK